MKIRVAIVLPYFGNGGAENMVSRLTSHLDLNRVEAEVICIYGDRQNNELERNIWKHGVPIKYIHKGKGFSLSAIIRLNQELADFRPQIIHTHLSACVYCIPWVLTHQITMLHTVHNMPAYELIKPKRILMSIMYKIRKAVPVAISHEIQRLMKEEYKLNTKVELVYNPVDIVKFDFHLKENHNKYTIVSVGRLSIQKNQQLLFQAFEKVLEVDKEAELYILGDGPLRNKLETYILKHKLEHNIYLEGNVNNVEDYFAKADVFALSSSYEGLPLAVLEAMAAGLPIVSTDVGGVRDIVTDNGILVNPGDVDDLSHAMILLKDNRKLRDQMSICSKHNIVRFDTKIIAKYYVDLYEKYTGNI